MSKLALFLIGYVLVEFTGYLLAFACSSMERYRLSGDIVPQSYNLEIIVDIDEPNFGFNGIVSIQILCLNATKSITLHSSDLIITEDEVLIEEYPLSENTETLHINEQVYVPGSQFYRIYLEKSLNSNKSYLIRIPFKGTISTGLVGLYRSRYIDSTSNATRWMASTHFEPIYARKAFPCFDEPAMKAKFSIKLGHKEIYKSLSNMPMIKSYPMADKTDWVWSEFEESIPMSTYLVSYVIGDISYKEADLRSNNVKFAVWARADVLDQIDFATTFGPDVLEYYEKYFNIKYPLPKLDLIAIPDFSIGAMENWGLITFREAALLYNEKGSTIKDKHAISSVIAHEIAHQWFGNLVTMKWWTDLWLKEGFATFLGNMGVQELYPQWHFLEEAVLKNVESVYYLDSLQSSHQVSVQICNPSEIAQIFDIISYQKGSMIIRMMNSFLGKSFQHGLSDYLVEHKYGNAAQDDLWDALTKRAHKDGILNKNMTVKEVMDSWTLQTGYPLITVQRDYEKETVIVSQERYYLRKSGKEETDKQLWWIPLTYTSLSERKFADKTTKYWLRNESEVINVNVKPEDWIIFNLEIGGLYRVQYDNRNWKMIIATLNSDNYTIIPAMNRANLLLDIFDLAWKGELKYSLALKMAKYLNRETEYVPLSFGLQKLSAIGGMLIRTPIYGNFQTYIRSLIGPIYARYDNLLDAREEPRIHALITEWACEYDIEKCCTQALNLFKQWQHDSSPDKNNPIPTDIRGAVYSTAVRFGGSEVWDFLWDVYRNSNYATEKRIILRALGYSRDVWILNRFLEWSIQENSGIRRQDSALVFITVVSQPVGAYVATEFLKRRITEIHKYHSQKSEVMSSYLASSAKHFIYQYEINEWHEFIDKHMDLLKGSSLAAKQSVDVAYAQGEWNELHYSEIAQLLSS